MIKDIELLFDRLNKLDCELRRGCAGGWVLDRDGKAATSVHAGVAEEAIESGRLVRTDDKTTRVGETYKLASRADEIKLGLELYEQSLAHKLISENLRKRSEELIRGAQ
jgi:hypothetical protein